MSEEDKPKNYMQQLDEWTDAHIISPLYVAYCENGYESARERAEEAVHKAIREKVLESYHNGKAAQGPGTRKRTAYAKR